MKSSKASPLKVSLALGCFLLQLRSTAAQPGATDWIFGIQGQSCNDACGTRSCNVHGMERLTSADQLRYVANLLGIECGSFEVDVWFPFVNPSLWVSTGVCFHDDTDSGVLVECDGSVPSDRRICCCGEHCPTSENEIDNTIPVDENLPTPGETDTMIPDPDWDDNFNGIPGPWDPDWFPGEENCTPFGSIPHCASYSYDPETGEEKCRYCERHYELDHQGRCSACVVCVGPYGEMDFCPLHSEAWGGVIPRNPWTDEYTFWPQIDYEACDEYVRWGAEGYDHPELDHFYCSSDHPVAWVYRIEVVQEESTIVDGIPRQVIYTRSGDDHDFRIPARPVMACEQDTIIVEAINAIDGSQHHGDAFPFDDQEKLGITFHWHGQFQEHNQFMDGVAMVSQCPIGNIKTSSCHTQHEDPDVNTFIYKFRANPHGTFWFHSHTGLQYGDGLIGPLIIYDRENPYRDSYEVELPPVMIGDWWHKLSQELVVNLFYGTEEGTGSCELNHVQCTPRYQARSASAFNCLCGGGTSDYDFKSGFFNGKAQFPEITTETTSEEARFQKFEEIFVEPGRTYRLRAINSGFNFGFRFSIDDHRFDLIAADGAYCSAVQDLTHFNSMPAERYDIIFRTKTYEELEREGGGKQFFIRARTYNDTYWGFNHTENAYDLRNVEQTHTIFAVLNYDLSARDPDHWFANPDTKLSRDLQRPAPSIEKVLDVSLYFSNQEYEDWYGVTSDRLVTSLRDFRYTGPVPGCSTPAPDGRGPVGAPFGCDAEGFALPAPKPDLFLHLWVNGIMYPAYNLFLAKSPVLNYDDVTESDQTWQDSIHTIGEPNMFARAEVPLVYTRGMRDIRNLDVQGASPDSPGRDPDVSPPPNDWGEFTKFNYGTDSNIGVTNRTEMVYLPKNKWVMVVQHDGGPMTHPFHIHGYNAHVLASGANYDQFRTRMSGCTIQTDDPNRLPLMLDPDCAMAAANYMNGYGAELIPPVRGRFQPAYTLEDLHDPEKTNWIDPPKRDMPTVPPHGYVVWMFYTGNPGAWFYHCHLEFHVGLGMALAFMVGADGDDWVNGHLNNEQIDAMNQGNCGDVEFEGPIQFF